MLKQLERRLKLTRVQILKRMIDGEDDVEIVVDAETRHEDLVVELEEALIEGRSAARFARHLRDGDDGSGDISGGVNADEDPALTCRGAFEPKEIVANDDQLPAEASDHLLDESLRFHAFRSEAQTITKRG